MCSNALNRPVAWLPACGLAAVLLARAAADPATPARAPLRPHTTPGGEIFDQPTVLDFRLQMTRANLRALRENAREYTPVTILVNGQTFTNVGVKLKGAAGSFRGVDDQPAMTLHFSKWVNGRRLFGIRRLHLNNSVQDPSYLNEYLGGTLFRDAGVPTPRSAWATVHLGDRDLGLYVLKEAFETEFLRTFFNSTDGNLYDGGFVRDIDQDLELDSGFGVKDHSDLHALSAAVRERDDQRRWERLCQLVDADRFATYAALSVMLVDWDGYPLNRNNYRIYFRPDDGRAVFMPHGMDQLFQRSYLELDTGWSGAVAWGLLETNPGRKLYEERVRQVYTNVFQVERMTNLIARAVDVLRPVQPDIDQRASELVDRIQSRLRVLRRDPLLKPPAPPPPPGATHRTDSSLSSDGFRPTAWQPQRSDNATLEGPLDLDGKRLLRITARDRSTASWRGTVTLKAGKYRFEGRLRARGIQPLRDDRGEGAGLRIAGEESARANQLGGDADWTLLSHRFDIARDGTEITLVGELRATRGQVEFEVPSLRVVPVAR